MYKNLVIYNRGIVRNVILMKSDEMEFSCSCLSINVTPQREVSFITFLMVHNELTLRIISIDKSNGLFDMPDEDTKRS